jgi:hypothetical protein
MLTQEGREGREKYGSKKGKDLRSSTTNRVIDH